MNTYAEVRSREGPQKPMASDPICGVSSLGNPEARPDAKAKEPNETNESPTEEAVRMFEETAQSAKRLIEEKSRRLTEVVITRLRQAKERGDPIRSAPARMRRTADQLELCIELISDMRTGKYRDISWPVALIISGAILYSVSPADLIPDVLPALGSIDDAIVLALATNLARGELKKYCQFKGYDEGKFFRDKPS